MKFIYRTRNKEGLEESGIVEASSKEAAAEILAKYNVFVTSLARASSGFLFLQNIKIFNRVSKKDLVIFFRQLAVMLESRVPVVQSLNSLASQIKKEYFREKITKIGQLVEEGNSLSEAMSAFPDVFNIFHVNLIKTGEASGRISESLYFLSDHLEREDDINAQVRGAMIYPIFVVSVLMIVIAMVVFIVMPRLIDLLNQTTANPSFFTRTMIGFYQFLINFGVLIFAAFVGLIALFVFYLRTESGAKMYDKASLRLPLIGSFFKKTHLMRFAENISTLITAGLPINTALKITEQTVDSFIYKDIISKVGQGVTEGEKISQVLSRYPDYTSPFVIQMIRVGEETGKLDKNLLEIVNFYRKDVKRAIDTFIGLLEPILIIFLGIIVAFLAVSVLSPLYSTLGSI